MPRQAPERVETDPVTLAPASDSSSVVVALVNAWNGNPHTWKDVRAEVIALHGDTAETHEALISAFDARRRRVLLSEEFL